MRCAQVQSLCLRTMIGLTHPYREQQRRPALRLIAGAASQRPPSAHFHRSSDLAPRPNFEWYARTPSGAVTVGTSDAQVLSTDISMLSRRLGRTASARDACMRRAHQNQRRKTVLRCRSTNGTTSPRSGCEGWCCRSNASMAAMDLRAGAGLVGRGLREGGFWWRTPR
jgi:hypothetical protein